MKIVLCLLFIAIAATLFNTGHAISDFAPKHVATGYEIFSTGDIPDQGLSAQVPAFYSFVATLFFVLDVGPFTLIHSPVQLVPYVVVFFALTYLVTDGNVTIAAVLSGLFVFLPSSATQRIHLLSHGLGDILLFTVLLCVILLFRIRRKNRILPLLLVCSVSLVYVSYNKTATALLILIATYVLIKFAEFNGSYLRLSSEIESGTITTVLVVTSTVMSLFLLTSDFFHSSFIPLITSGFGGDTGFLRFVFTWVGTGTPEASNIAHMLLVQPESVRYLAIARYIIVFTGIVLFLSYVSYKVKDQEPIIPLDVFILSYLGGISVYFFVRFFVGTLPIAEFFLPGALAIGYLYSHVDQRRVHTLVLVLFVVLSVTIVATQIENNRHGEIDRNADVVYNMNDAQGWIESYSLSDRGVYSDEFTRNLFTYTDMIGEDVPSYRESSDKYDLIRVEQTAALTTFDDPGEGQYYVLNNYHRSMSLQQWRIIAAWDTQRDELDRNDHSNKIYTEGDLWVFSS